MDAITQRGRETRQNYEPKQTKEGWGDGGGGGEELIERE